MKSFIFVQRGAVCRYFPILPTGNFQKLILEGVFVFDLAKFHDHRYDLDAFFYDSKRIVTGRSYKSKKELIGAIQKLLQEELHVDVQFCSWDK